MQVFYFLGAKRQPLFLVVFFDTFYVLDGLRLMIDGEDILVKTVVHALKHAIVFRIPVLYGEVFLYTQNAIETHILGNLNGIRTPWGYHFAARAYKEAFELFLF